MTDPSAASPFVPLPTPFGRLLCLLGPKPEEAAVAVEPLTKLDTPLGLVQSFVGGLCGRDGQLIRPVEIVLLLDPAVAPPSEIVPIRALLSTHHALPELHGRLPAVAGGELIRAAFGSLPCRGPLLYCRKRHRLFAARSPNTAEPLSPVPPPEKAAQPVAATDGIPLELLVWDGPPAEGRKLAIYSGRRGQSAVGPVAAFDQLILDQGQVVRLAGQLAEHDPAAHQRLTAEHTCCTCPERERCFPTGAGYAYAADRLVVIHALSIQPVVLPLGEWRLDEAARVLGGVSAKTFSTASSRPSGAFEVWRNERAAALEAAGPRLLLTDEPNGRALAEIARLKLALLADVLAQLDAAWIASKRPHLCWNNDTVRVAWSQSAQTPASAWGFRALLRKIGIQPVCDVVPADAAPLPYPPAFSTPALMAPEVGDALRHFGARRGGNVFVKSTKKRDEKTLQVEVLLEELGISRELFCPADAIFVAADGWEAELAPTGVHNPDDGAGLAARGGVRGDAARWKPGESLEGCACRWYPRFGEAVDLHAVGMLLLETLLASDERDGRRLGEAVLAERAELLQACRSVPLEQREAQARTWIAARCETDTPGALWSRRNLLYSRADRAAASLDGLPAALWQAVVTLGLRLIAPVAGFGYCDDRTAPAPRSANGHLLPLLELRGLIALLDDLILRRESPGAAVRDALRAAD